MNEKKRRIIHLVPTIILLSGFLIAEFISPIYGKNTYGVISSILNWLPNYVASMVFVMMGAQFVIGLTKTKSNRNLYRHYNLLMIAVSLFGLTGFI